MRIKKDFIGLLAFAGLIAIVLIVFRKQLRLTPARAASRPLMLPRAPIARIPVRIARAPAVTSR